MQPKRNVELVVPPRIERRKTIKCAVYNEVVRAEMSLPERSEW